MDISLEKNEPMNNKFGSLGNAVKLAQFFVARVLQDDDIVIDATCGNGHDTAFLASKVIRGRVFAFDLSPLAVSRTTELMVAQGLSERVVIHQDNFRNIPEYIDNGVAAVMFNLGYLPGADRETATLAADSVAAILLAAPLLKLGGVMTVVCYPGNPRGMEETIQVRNALAILDQKEYEVVEMSFINGINDPPILILTNRIRRNKP